MRLLTSYGLLDNVEHTFSVDVFMTASQEHTRELLKETIEWMKQVVVKDPSPSNKKSMASMEEHYMNYVLSDGMVV